ncbi:MAG: EAL domain-containing protein [Wenzhouxiangella sp.]
MRRWLLTVACLWLALDAAASVPLRSAGDADFPPYEFLAADGQPDGFNVDLLNAIASQLERPITISLGRWADARAALAAGQVDVVAMYAADFRDEEFQFSSPFLIINHEIFVRQGGAEASALEDLSGLSILVQRDSWLHERLISQAIDAELFLVDSERSALLGLAEGRADTALVSTQVGRRVLQQEGLEQVVTSGGPMLPAAYGFAVQHDQDALLEAIDESLRALRASGEFNRLYQHWFGEPPPERQETATATPWLLLVLGGLGLTVIIAWLLDRQRTVRAKAAIRTDGGDTADRAGLLTALEACVRTQGHQPALILIDLDQFRLVNEQTDPIDGDRILGKIRDQLVDVLAEGERLFRFGGDKFAVLLPQANQAQALRRAECLRERIAQQTFGEGDQSLQLTASLGISLADDSLTTAGRLIKRAEAACFAAKERGRNRSCLFSDDDARMSEASERMYWVREAGRALRENRLLLHFQTIEPARHDPEAPIRAELLLRLRQPDGQIICAGVFMPACEHHYLAQRIDLHVLELSLRWLKQHEDRLPDNPRFYINLSARSLDDDRFLPAVLELFETYPVDPRLVGFEVTETAVMNHLRTGLKTINALCSKGCTFALDDFGIGSSSMAYLKQLPVQEVKIDGSFLHAVRRDPTERRVLRDINTLIQTLGKTSVIEQVETSELRDLVADLGIDYVQGWAVSHPRPLSDFPLKPANPEP